MPNYPEQILFLQNLKEKLPVHLSLAEELSDLLELSTDSVYRRLRGESALTLDESLKICRHFKVNLESLTPALTTSQVAFQYQALHVEATAQLKNYLQRLYDDLSILVRIPEASVTYAAGDLPLFLHFHFPEHAAFKLFFWMKSVLNVPEFQQKKFSREAIPNEILDLGKELLVLYNQLQTQEVWTSGVCDSTLKQIRYYWESDLFEKKEDALLVCQQFLNMLETAQHQASSESKNEHTKNYSLYLSEIEVGNNCILVEAAGTKKVYIRHQTFQYLSTGNIRFCDDTMDWITNTIRKSVLISGVAEKERNRFFARRKEAVQKLMDEINI
jgi:hypothetical protein